MLVKPALMRSMKIPIHIQEELEELSTIPILENELMWVSRVISEELTKELPSSDESESSK